MARAKAQPKVKGIFCLEADWWGVKDQTTVEPVLQLLNSAAHFRVPYIYRRIGTREGFDHYISKWTTKSLSRYPILYLAFHGERGALCVGQHRGKRGRMTVDELAEILGDKCKGKVIHFGSCLTLDLHGHTLNAFVRKTGALAVLGYRDTVDWVESAAFEVLVLGELQDLSLTKQGLRRLESRVCDRAPKFAKRLGFRVVSS